MAGIEQQPIVLLNPARAQGQLERLSEHNVALANQAAQLEEEKLALQRKVNELEGQIRDDAEKHLGQLTELESKVGALEKRLMAMENTLKRQ